jgi:hypothetical protein
MVKVKATNFISAITIVIWNVSYYHYYGKPWFLASRIHLQIVCRLFVFHWKFQVLFYLLNRLDKYPQTQGHCKWKLDKITWWILFLWLNIISRCCWVVVYDVQSDDMSILLPSIMVGIWGSISSLIIIMLVCMTHQSYILYVAFWLVLYGTHVEFPWILSQSFFNIFYSETCSPTSLKERRESKF